MNELSSDPHARAFAAAPLRRRMETAPRPDRVLVLRLGALGDVVRTLPAASALRTAWPGAWMAWLAEPAAASALRGRSWLDEVIELPRPELVADLRRRRPLRAARRLAGVVRELRARRFDLVVDFHGILKSGVLSRLSGAAAAVGYGRPAAREGAGLWMTRRAELRRWPVSRFERNAALVRFLGVDAEPFARPLDPDPGRVERARHALGAGPAPAPVLLHAGSSPRTPHKRYAPERLGAVARSLASRTGRSCRVLRGPGAEEAALARRVVEASGGAARPAPETRDFEDLAALLACGGLYVGPDSGPLHVASLVGTPVVQILGPTHPAENAPWPGTPARSVRRAVACAPCRRGCAAATCLSALPPEAVVEAALELLACTGGAAASQGSA